MRTFTSNTLPKPKQTLTLKQPFDKDQNVFTLPKYSHSSGLKLSLVLIKIAGHR